MEWWEKRLARWPWGQGQAGSHCLLPTKTKLVQVCSFPYLLFLLSFFPFPPRRNSTVLRMTVTLTWSMKIYRTFSTCPQVLPWIRGPGQPLPPKDLICTRSEAPGAPHHLIPMFKALLPWPAPRICSPTIPTESHLQTLCQAGPSSVFKSSPG